MEPHINATSACENLVFDSDFQELDKPFLQHGSRYARLNSGNISVKAKGLQTNVSEQVQTLSKAFSGRHNHSCALPGQHAALGLKDKKL